MCTTCQSSISRAEIEKNIYLNLYQGTARKTLYPMYLPSACFNLLVSYILILCNIQKSRIKLVKLGKICDGKRKPASLLVHMKMFADQKFHHRIVENQIYLPALCNWNSSANYITLCDGTRWFKSSKFSIFFFWLIQVINNESQSNNV